MRELDVGQTVDERLAEVSQLMQQWVILLLNGLVLLLHGLQVGLHGGDLRNKEKGFAKTTDRCLRNRLKRMNWEIKPIKLGKKTYLCPKFNHVWLYLIVRFIKVFDFFIQLFDFFIVLNPWTKWGNQNNFTHTIIMPSVNIMVIILLTDVTFRLQMLYLCWHAAWS